MLHDDSETIGDIMYEDVMSVPPEETEEEVVAHFSDGNKQLILNKTNMKTIAKIYKRKRDIYRKREQRKDAKKG